MSVRSLLSVGLLLALGSTSAFAVGMYDLGAGAAPTGATTDGSVVAFNLSGANVWSRATAGSTNIGATYTTAGAANTTYYAGTSIIVGGNMGGNAQIWKGNAAGTGTWTALALPSGGAAWTAVCTSASGSDAWVAGNTVGTGNGTKSALRYKASSNSATTASLPSSGNKDSYFYGASDIGTFAGRAQYGAVYPSGSRMAMAGALGSQAWMNPIIGAASTSNSGVANAISRDGVKAGGWSKYATGFDRGLTLWTVATGAPTQLPFTGTYDYGEIQALNSNGTIAAGYQSVGGANKAAFIWTSADGTQDLATYLTGLGVGLTGWTLTDVKGMSGDGRVLTGLGTYGGTSHGWVIVIPEPSSLSVLALGLLGLLKFRRR
jgi:hypothetical protein